MGHLQMNQQAEGIQPVPKGGHNRDVWEERILEQYTDPLHRLAVQSDMELIRSYDRRIELIEQQLIRQAKKVHGRDYELEKKRGQPKKGQPMNPEKEKGSANES